MLCYAACVTVKCDLVREGVRDDVVKGSVIEILPHSKTVLQN